MVQNSPSSINTYNQCPRLYYYQYVARKPSFPHIDLLKGEVVHSALRLFFEKTLPLDEGSPEKWARGWMKQAFMKAWEKRRAVIERLGLSSQEVQRNYRECGEMLGHWVDDFLKRAQDTKLDIASAFEKLKPQTEAVYKDEKYDVVGVIDVVDHGSGEVRIIDYKTSSKFDITREYKLQLAIYAYLYKVKTGIRPAKVGINFLKEGLHLIAVDDEMMKYAEDECRKINEKTKSSDIADYPQNTGYLCKQMKDRCPCRKYEQESES